METKLTEVKGSGGTVETVDCVDKTPHAIDALISLAHRNAVNKGWWEDGGPSFGEFVALCHSELSEALEEHRNSHSLTEISFGPDGKPEGIPVELADVMVRIFDFCGAHNIDLRQALYEKMEYNTVRPYRHGGKTI